ncbi:MAG: hypothetical protein QF473_34995, partial [Planctomycetota bacterium]|nr:hypothetical protein [Planctomycetota bacterium]
MTSGPQQSDSGSTSSLISHLGHLLLQNAVISGAQLQEANQLALAESLSFDQALIRMRFCTESQLAQILAHITRSRLVDLNQVEPDAQYLRRVPMSYALDHCCLPVGIEENH